MSRTVDERVVEMRFDNRNFESNVSQSMSTLEKLKAKLKLGDSAKSLENLGKAANKLDLSHMGGAIDAVSAKFSALQVVGVTTLANLTNSAVNAGKRMVKALTIDPVSTGFSEYETKINAIQTIMSNTASKGTTMEDVTRVIDELNTYADKTIYNFAEMTRNIGTFTAAGVGLEESDSAIQGIANLAAASGSTSQQASTVMYQLSQALAAGTVKLMDWNSVVNAGMGGEKFQEALKATAREHGIAVDEIIKKNGSFRESLQEGWISADILNETLNKFTVEGATAYAKSMMDSGKWTQEQADALIKEAHAMEDAATKVKTFTQLIDTLKESLQSGWGKTWELIFGDFLEAREFFTELSDRLGGIINKMSDWRNGILQGALDSKWNVFEQRLTKAGINVDTFTNKFKQLAESRGINVDRVLAKYGSIGEAIEAGAFGTKGRLIIDTLKAIAGAEGDLGEATGVTTDKLEYFQKMVTEVVRGDWGNGVDRFNALTAAGHDYAAIQEQVNNCWDGMTLDLTKLSIAQIESMGYTTEQAKALKELAEEAEKTGTPLNELIESMTKPSGRELFIYSIRNILDSIGLAFSSIKTAWNDIFPPKSIEERSAALYKLLEAIHGITVKVEEFLKNEDNVDRLVRSFKGLFAAIDIVMTLAGGGLRLILTILSKLLGAFGVNVLDVTANVGDMIVALRDWIKAHDPLTKAIDYIVPHIEKLINGIKSWIQGLKETDNIPKYIIGSLVSGIKSGAQAVIGAISDLASSILDTFKSIFDEHSPSKETFKIGAFLIEGLINGMKSVFGKAIESVSEGAKKVIDKLKTVFAGVDFTSLVGAGLAAGLLVVVGKIAKVLDRLSSPLDGLEDVFDSVTDVLNGLGKNLKAGAMLKRGKALLYMAAAIAVLAASLYLLSLIELGDLIKGVLVIAALAFILDKFTDVAYKLQNAVGFTINSAGIIGISIAIIILVAALKVVADMKLGAIVKGLGTLVIVIGLLLVVLYAIAALLDSRGSKQIDKAGIMISKIAFALLVMVAVIKLSSMLSLGEIKRGVLVIGICSVFFMLLIGIFKRMPKDSGQYADKAGKMVFKMALAMLIMIGVMKLASMLSLGEIKRGGTAIALMGGVFAALIVVSKFAGQHAAKAGTMILLMSSSFLILAFTMHIVSKLDDKGLERGCIAIGVMAVAFALLIGLSKLAGRHAAKAGVMIMLMSTALVILTGVIFLIGNMDPEVVWRGVAAIGVLIIFFGALIAVTHFANDCKGTLITLTVVISLLTVAIIALSFIPTKDLFSAAGALAIAMLAFAAVVYSLKSLENVKMGRAIGTLITLAAVVVILALVIKALSKLQPARALASAGSLAILLVALAGSMVLISKFGKQGISLKAFGSLAALIGIMVLLGALLYAIQAFDIKSSLPTVASISILLVVLTGVFILINNFGGPNHVDGKTIKAFIGLIFIMALLGALLYAIKYLNVQPCLPVVGSLIILLAALTGVYLLLNNIAGHNVVSIGTIGALIGLTAILALLGLVLAMITALKADACLPQVKSIIIMLVAITGVYLVLNALAPLNEFSGGTFLSLVGMVAIMALLGLVLFELTKLKVDACEPQVKSLCTLLISMSAALVLLGIVGAMGINALIGVGILAALAVVIGAAIWAFSEFVSPSLPGLALNLSLFALGLKPFLDVMKGVDESVVNGAKGIADCIIALAGANIISSLSTIFSGGSFSKMGELLLEFGDYMAKFNDKIKNINVDAVNAASNAGNMLTALCDSVPRTGGKLNEAFESIFGSKDLDGFGRMLMSFGMSMVGFSTIVSGNIDDTAVMAAASACAVMAKVADNIPNSGGVLGEWLGNNDIDMFGTMLVSFGESIVKFSNTLKEGEIDADAIQAAADAGSMMAELADNIPNSGGFLGDFLGNNDIDDFGEMLVSFGESIVAFSNTLKEGEVDTTAVEAAANAGTMMAKMAQEIPNEDGFVEKIFGNNDMKKFGEKLEPFGKAIVSFSDTVAGKIDAEAITAAAIAGETLAKMAQSIPSDCDWADVLLGNNDIDNFGKKLGGFGSGLKAFSDATDGLNVDNINKADDSINSVVRIVNSLSSETIDDFCAIDTATFKTTLSNFGGALIAYSDSLSGLNVEQLTNSTTQLVKLINTLKGVDADTISGIDDFINSLGNIGADSVDGFISAFNDSDMKVTMSIMHLTNTVLNVFKNKSSGYKKAGVNLMTQLREGISNGSKTVTKAITSVLNSMVSKIKNYYSKVKTAGGYLVEGFAKGIEDSKYLATQEAEAVAKSAKEAIEEALGIESPSKELYKDGRWTVMGFANGLRDFAGVAYKAGTTVADRARTGLTDVVGRISDIINSDIDAQPTIRPILDMSNVENGVASLNSMLNVNPSIGLLSNVSSIDTMMNSRGFGDVDIISAIDKLRKDLGNIGGVTNNYIDGITYDDGSNISEAVHTLVRAARIERRS